MGETGQSFSATASSKVRRTQVFMGIQGSGLCLSTRLFYVENRPLNMKTAALEPRAKPSLKKVNPNGEKGREASCFKFLTFWVTMQIPKDSRGKPRKPSPGPLLWAAGRPYLCSCGRQLLGLPTSPRVSSDAQKEVSATATYDFRGTTLTEAQPWQRPA